MTTILDHSELGGLDAITTAEHIRAGGLSVREAVEAAIDRARALGPALNAISTEMFESALRRAEAAVTKVSARRPRGVKWTKWSIRIAFRCGVSAECCC